MDFMTEFMGDEIKETGRKFYTKWIDKKRWEAIFVEAGNAVAEFENYHGDEQSEIRSIVFGRNNMLQLADWLWERGSFEFKKNLEDCLDSLLNQSELLEENIENCRCHFINIVMKDIKEQFVFVAEKYRDQETHDMVQQQGMMLQYQNTMLQNILLEVQSQSVESKTINYQSRNHRKVRVKISRKREKWVLSRCNRGGFMKFDQEQFRNMIDTWREERKEYPGWFIMPGNVCKELFYKTTYFLGNHLDLFSIEERVLILFEFVWRHETGMFPYEKSFQRQVFEIWKQYQSVLEEDGSIDKGVKEWFFLGRSLLREFRENREENKWNEVWKGLKVRCTDIENGKVLLQLDEIKYQLSIYHINKVRVLLSKIHISKECYDIRLNLAGMEVACGNLEVAVSKLKALIEDLKREMDSSDMEDKVYVVSMYPVVLHMYAFVIQGIAWERNEYEKKQEMIYTMLDEIEDYADYFDFDHVKNLVREVLLEWQIKRHERKETFELNRTTMTIFGGRTRCEEAYYLYRILDAATFPLMCNSVNLLRDMEIPWLLALYENWSSIALNLMLRCSNADIGEYILTRSRLASCSKEVVDRDIKYLENCIEYNLDEFEDHMIDSDHSVCYYLQNNIPKILVRYMSRCPENLQSEVLLLLKKIMERPDVLLDNRIDQFIYGIIGSVSEKIKADILEELIQTEIVEHKVMYGHFPSVDLFDFYFRKDASIKYCQRTEKIIHAIHYLLSDENDDTYMWRTKIKRLQILDQMDLLLPDEKQQFIKKMWSRINPETKLPDVDNWYISTFLNFEDSSSQLPSVSVKQYLLDRRLMLTLAKEDGIWISRWEPSYLDEMRVLLGNVEKDFWTKEQVELIFQDALDYWEILKQKMDKNCVETSFVIQEYERKIYKTIDMLVGLYKGFTGNIAPELANKVRSFINDLEQNEIGAIALQLLFAEEKKASNLVETMVERFYDTDNMITLEAMNAAYHFVERYPKHQKTPGILEHMIWVLRTRKEPGLISMINIIHNLIYQENPIITNQIVDQLDRCLMLIEQATRYDMEDEGIIKNKALIRKACASLAYQIAEKFPERDCSGVSCWKEVCAGEEFTEVKNEMLLPI